MKTLHIATVLLGLFQLSTSCIAQQTDVSFAAQQRTDIQQNALLLDSKATLLNEIQHKPTANAYDLLGDLELRQHDDAGAIQAFQRALILSPKLVSARISLGNVYSAQKKIALAENEFREVLRSNPKNQDAMYSLGILLLNNGAPAQAIKYLQSISPPNLEANFCLIRAYLETRRTADALRLTALLSAENKSDPQLHLSLGLLLATEKQYKFAQLELEKADALQPNDFNILFQLGQISLLYGEHERADLALSQALSLEPESIETLYLLAKTYNTEQRSLDALDLLVRANKLSPDNPDILYLMAEISMSQKFYEDAIPLLEKALLIAPDRYDLHAALGECDFKAGKFERSAAEFSQLIKIHASARNYAFLGLSQVNLGRFADATQDFRSCLTLEPNNNFCLFELGDISRMQGDTVEATSLFQKVLKANPDYPDALLKLADIQIQNEQFNKASVLLEHYVLVSDSPANGYYKLAMLHKKLHNLIAANKDLEKFQSLSKEDTVISRPYDHLFDYLNNRSQLNPSERNQHDLKYLVAEAQAHPDHPDVLIALAGAYLRSGQPAEAKRIIASIDDEAAADPRLLMKAGVLLARYSFYKDAIPQFYAAQYFAPISNEALFNLATAYFRVGDYSEALDAALKITAEGRKDDTYLALLADIYAHLNSLNKAEDLYQDAIARDPDNDQNYLSLALLDFRSNNITEGKQVLLTGHKRVPASGKIMWGLGLTSALQGDNKDASSQLEHAVDMLPEWQGTYSTLGFFYYQTGQIAKAKELLERFKSSGIQNGLDLSRIKTTLEQAHFSSANIDIPLSSTQRTQLLQFALLIVDKTL